MKTFTKFGSPVETNLPEDQHNTIHKMLEFCEEQVLKQSDGKHSLIDIIKSDDPLKRLQEMKVEWDSKYKVLRCKTCGCPQEICTCIVLPNKGSSSQ